MVAGSTALAWTEPGAASIGGVEAVKTAGTPLTKVVCVRVWRR
jgi:hypothetical protein